MKDLLDNLTTRQLQLEVSRAISTISADNTQLSKFNKMTDHDSIAWYKTVLRQYISEHGDLPSITGPGKAIKLLYEDI